MGHKKVIVAMSGGVDSSVAALLLQRAGYEVIGVTLNLMRCDQLRIIKSCCGFDAARQAREMAAALGVVHHVLDCADEFRQKVLWNSWLEYANGATPNPCLWCNQHIKFGRLLDFAKELGARQVATGHYARIQTDDQWGQPVLLRGLDTQKDQSYFLYPLTVDQLSSALFPVGEYHKAQVKELAAQAGLACAESPESQDACFVTQEGTFPESLRALFGATAACGAIFDDQGRQVGQHPGVHNYTIGQRKGLGVALGKPAWIYAIDPSQQSLHVTTDAKKMLSKVLIATQVQFSAAAKGFTKERAEVQLRYRHKAAPAWVERIGEKRIRIEFDRGQRAVTPGQAAVFYSGECLLGGGRIEHL